MTIIEEDVRSDGDTNIGNGVLVIESCHGSWLFDVANRRFRRTVKGLSSPASVLTAWRPYHRLLVSDTSDAFVIFLDEALTRLLRSRRHPGPHCELCCSGSDLAARSSTRPS